MTREDVVGRRGGIVEYWLEEMVDVVFFGYFDRAPEWDPVDWKVEYQSI